MNYFYSEIVVSFESLIVLNLTLNPKGPVMQTYNMETQVISQCWELAVSHQIK